MILFPLFKLTEIALKAYVNMDVLFTISDDGSSIAEKFPQHRLQQGRVFRLPCRLLQSIYARHGQPTHMRILRQGEPLKAAISYENP